MAVTRIMAMHLNKGRTIAQCLKDRTDYAKNPGKTMGGELISAFGCDPRTADAEFLFAKRQYRQFTGREPKNDVIAYQIRQSFKPGEVTPEEANRIGYELAKRFLKERHAFFVATHCGYGSYSQPHHLQLHLDGLPGEIPGFSRLRQSGCAAERPDLSGTRAFCD